MSQTKARSHVDLLNGSSGKIRFICAVDDSGESVLVVLQHGGFYDRGNFRRGVPGCGVEPPTPLTNVFIGDAIGGNGASVITSQYLGAKTTTDEKRPSPRPWISFQVEPAFWAVSASVYNGNAAASRLRKMC